MISSNKGSNRDNHRLSMPISLVMMNVRYIILIAEITTRSLATVIESLCVNCHEQGKTTILLTKIPYFKGICHPLLCDLIVMILDVIIMSFNCDECGFKNNEVQTGAIQEKGAKIRLRLTNKKVNSLLLSAN